MNCQSQVAALIKPRWGASKYGSFGIPGDDGDLDVFVDEISKNFEK